jgi:hypothetical protein
VVETTARVAEARLNIIQNEVGKFIDHLVRCEAGSEEIENIDDANTHPTNAGPATTLARIDGDSIRDLGHGAPLKARSIRQDVGQVQTQDID